MNEYGMKVAKKLGVDDAVFLSATGTEQMIRFANDSLTVVKRLEEKVFSVYSGGGRQEDSRELEQR